MIHSSTNVDVPRAALVAASFLCACLVAESPAWAEVPSSARAMARSLFEQGRELVAQEKYAEACPKLAESQRLDPAAGTQLNLAVCHEGEGKTATAWSEYNDALTQARRDGRPEREQFVVDRLRALSPKLSWLTFVVATPDLSGLEVTFDGATVGRAALGIASPADPGTHTVTARAPGYAPWSSEVHVAATAGARQNVAIPKLTPKPEATASAAPSAAGVDATATSSTSDGREDPSAEPRPGRRALGITLAGTGAAAIIVGTAFGVRAVAQWSERNAACRDGCTADGVAHGDAAMTSAWIANLAIGGGLLALGSGIYFVVTSNGSSSAPAAARTARVHAFPVVTGNQAGLGFAGEWR